MLIIVPCGSAKRDYPCAAGEMYTGGYHRGCLRYALAKAHDPSRVFILSALYGLLRLSDEIKPYNLKMGQRGSISVLELRAQATELAIIDETEVIALGGVAYVNKCREVWPSCYSPLSGVVGIGRALRWLKENTLR